MTTFSKLFLAISFVTFGAAGTAIAAPASGHQLRTAKRAPITVAVNQPGKAKRAERPNMRHAIIRPMQVAQAAAPVQAKHAHQGKRHDRRMKRLEKFDTNKNGQIDEAERIEMNKQRFVKLDANNDRKITLAEMQAAKKMRQEKRALRRSEAGRTSKARSEHKGKRLEKRFARIDSNNNGSVTWQEFSVAKGKGQHRKR